LGDKVNGEVFFSNDYFQEVGKIKNLLKGYLRKIYVYGYSTDVSPFIQTFPDFVFVKLEDLLVPKNIKIITDNSENDFFVIKKMRFNDIMDRNIEILQSLKGYKLVVDDHPFLGKGEVSWSYFLWSFFDRSLLGYPHYYAFQTALKKAFVDCSKIALKVCLKSETIIKKVFEEDIITERFILNSETMNRYFLLKKELFEKWDSSGRIIRGLKSFINQQEPRLKVAGFDLTRFSRIYDQYQKGCRKLVLSDASIDLYLEKAFWEYVKNVNLFMETLWNQCH
jgi:hypothetical protein